MNIKIIPIGEATTRAQFRTFSVSQDKNGQYSATVHYVMQTSIGDQVIAESDCISATLGDAEVRSHPLFPELYPKIQEFTRSVLAAQRPDLVE